MDITALLASDNLPVAFAVAWVVVLMVGGLVGLLNKKIQDRGRFFERYFALASTAVAAIAFIDSSWQNRLAANDYGRIAAHTRAGDPFQDAD